MFNTLCASMLSENRFVTEIRCALNLKKKKKIPPSRCNKVSSLSYLCLCVLKYISIYLSLSHLPHRIRSRPTKKVPSNLGRVPSVRGAKRDVIALELSLSAGTRSKRNLANVCYVPSMRGEKRDVTALELSLSAGTRSKHNLSNVCYVPSMPGANVTS